MKEKKTFSNQKKKKFLKESVGSWRRAPGIRIRASSPRDSEACRCHGNGTGRAFKAQEPRVFIGPQTGNDRDGAGSGTRGGNSAVVRVGIDRGRKVGPVKTDEEGTFHEPATRSSLCLSNIREHTPPSRFRQISAVRKESLRRRTSSVLGTDLRCCERILQVQGA